MYESNDKMVSHPDHYQSKSGLEVIDVIKAFTEGLEGIEATDTGNIIKYACRWKHKNGVQDLKKIMWYTQHLIDHLESKNKFKVYVQTVDDAGDILAACSDILANYGYLMVADVKDLTANTRTSYRSNRSDLEFGWNNLKGTKIEQDGFNTMIIFPEPIDLKSSLYSKFNKKETN